MNETQSAHYCQRAQCFMQASERGCREGRQGPVGNVAATHMIVLEEAAVNNDSGLKPDGLCAWTHAAMVYDGASGRV